MSSGWPARRPSAEAGIGTLMLLLVSLPYLTVLADLIQLQHPADLWDNRTLGLLGAGLKLSAWVTGGALLLASMVLLLLGFTPASRLRWLLLIGIGLTFCIPPVAHLSAWQGLTLKAGFPPLLNATVVLTWSYFPLAVGILLLGLLNFNPASLEAGLLYGEPYRISRYLLLPPLLPSLFTAAVLIFLLTFIQSEVPSLVGYPVYADEFLARLVLEPTAAAAIGLALPQFAAVLVTVPLLLWLERGLLAHSWQTGGLRRLATLWPTYRTASWVTFGFLGVLLIPFISLLLRARFTGLIAIHGAALTTSLTLGLLSTVLAVLLAHLSADALVTVNAAWRAVLLTLVLLQFLLPGPLLALGMLKLANGLPWLKQGDVLLILTHALRLGRLITIGLTVLGSFVAHGADDWPTGLSFVGLKAGHWQLYLMAPEAKEPQPVVTAQEPRTPTYNPRVGKVAYIGSDASLREITLATATEQIVLNADAKHTYTQPAYDSDGKRLFVVALREGASVDTDILMLDETRHQAQAVVTQPLAQFEPRFQAPDTLYYASVSCNHGCGRIIQEIWRINLSSGEAEQLTRVNAIARQPVLATDSQWLYFASNQAGNFHLWRLNLASGQYEPLTTGRVTDSNPAFDHDHRLYFLRHTPAGVQLLRRENNGTLQALTLPEPFEDLRDLEINP